jgi:hypothetical protein
MALTPAPALALPEGRVYEMVSPPYKGGYGANIIEAVAPDGESVAFAGQGAFAEAAYSGINGYLARRGPSGWTTASLIAPASLIAAVVGSKEPQDFSATLESSLIQGVEGPNQGRALATSTENVFVLHPSGAPDTEANFHLAGGILKAIGGVPFRPGYIGASADFSHLLFHTEAPEPLLESAVGTRGQLYDLLTTGEGPPTLRLVGLNNGGQVINTKCLVTLGGTELTIGASGTRYNAIAADGSEIFFRATPHPVASTSECASFPGAIYVRLNGERTLQLSAPLPGGCAVTAPCHSAPQQTAAFQGANEAGTCVLFTTSQPLVSADLDTGTDLYLARVGQAGDPGPPCGPSAALPASREETSLVQVSHDEHAGENAEVQGVTAIAPDTSHVYFVARGALTDTPNAQGVVAIKGANNLYVYDTALGDRPVFVTDLCSGPETSGEVKDVRCPSNLQVLGRNDDGLGAGGEAQTAGQGRFLLFSSYGRLIANDTDTARDVYRYDAATGALDRVSLGEAGYDANGNNSEFDAGINGNGAGSAYAVEQAGSKTRAISEDGTRVVFTSAEPLSPAVSTALENVYEWHQQLGGGEGAVSLISTGKSTEPVNDVVISPSGRDIFFVTSEGLVPQDTDGALDVYDARLGGGFPAPAAPRQPCSGDACQGPLTPAAPLLIPGSVSQAPGENLTQPLAAPPAKVKAKAKRKAKRRRARHSRRSGRLTHRYGR